MKKGIVAFLDILGFSNFILDGESFSKNYVEYVDIIKNATKSENNLDYVLFSDSVIITSDDTTEIDLFHMFSAISDISFKLLTKLHVPLCGGISLGSFEKQIDDQNSIITGKPIVEAIEYEKRQNWIGVMTSPSVLKSHPSLKHKIYPNDQEIIEKHDVLKWGAVLFEYEKIPFSDSTYHGLSIIPHNLQSNSRKKVIQDVLDYKNKLDTLKLFAPSPYEQKKYFEASKYMTLVYQTLLRRAVKYHQLEW